MAWYNSNWTYRIAVTIQASQVDADLTDFPVFIDLADFPADFFSNVQSDGADIRVTKADGTTELAREVVAIDTTGQTGELHTKYTGTLSSSSDTTIYLYYGNASASAYADTATYGKYNVWDYEGVYHFTDLASNLPQNSAQNKYHGLSEGGTPNQVTGKVGEGMNYNGSDEYTTMADYDSGSGTEIRPTDTGAPYSFSGWFYPKSDATANQRKMWGIPEELQLYYDRNGNKDINFATWGGNVYAGAGPLALDTWHHYAVVYDWVNDWVSIWVNGTQYRNQYSYTDDPAKALRDNWYIGKNTDRSGHYFHGINDELRLVGAKALSSGWITTEYHNQETPSTFYAVGVAETQTATEVSCDFTATATYTTTVTRELLGETTYALTGILSSAGYYEYDVALDFTGNITVTSDRYRLVEGRTAYTLTATIANLPQVTLEAQATFQMVVSHRFRPKIEQFAEMLLSGNMATMAEFGEFGEMVLNLAGTYTADEQATAEAVLALALTSGLETQGIQSTEAALTFHLIVDQDDIYVVNRSVTMDPAEHVISVQDETRQRTVDSEDRHLFVRDDPRILTVEREH